MAAAVYWIVNGLMGIAVLAGVFLWARFLLRHYISGGETAPLLPMRRREPPFWNAFPALLVYLIHQFILIALFQALISKGWIQAPSDPGTATLNAGSAITTSLVVTFGGLMTLAVTMAWLGEWSIEPWRNRYFWWQLGLTLTRSDLRLAFVAALMILPPVLLVSFVAAWFVPYEHQVLKDLAAAPTFWVFVTLFVSTVIVTPIFEEVLFRMLLQGGLQGMVDQGVDERGQWVPRSHWPVIATSLIFASMHYGQGAAHYPLFFLALGLGYVYRQTGNLTAPILIHMLLNGLTLTVMFAEYRVGIGE